jgi:hypothetical protein
VSTSMQSHCISIRRQDVLTRTGDQILTWSSAPILFWCSYSVRITSASDVYCLRTAAALRYPLLFGLSYFSNFMHILAWRCWGLKYRDRATFFSCILYRHLPTFGVRHQRIGNMVRTGSWYTMRSESGELRRMDHGRPSMRCLATHPQERNWKGRLSRVRADSPQLVYSK